jgi:hypothetical protein
MRLTGDQVVGLGHDQAAWSGRFGETLAELRYGCQATIFLDLCLHCLGPLRAVTAEGRIAA